MPSVETVNESYVSPEEVAKFLSLNRERVVRLARAGKLPAHPIKTGSRCQWRFKLSEVDRHMQGGGINGAHPPVRQ